LLRPPTADTNTNFGSEPSISLRMSWMKDIGSISSYYGCSTHCDRPSADALAGPGRAVEMKANWSHTSPYRPGRMKHLTVTTASSLSSARPWIKRPQSLNRVRRCQQKLKRFLTLTIGRRFSALAPPSAITQTIYGIAVQGPHRMDTQ
jgi:hypothetical protein